METNSEKYKDILDNIKIFIEKNTDFKSVDRSIPKLIKIDPIQIE